MSGRPCSRVISSGSFKALSSGKSEGDAQLDPEAELEVGDDSASVPDAEDEGDWSRGLFEDGGDSVPASEDEGDWDPGSGGLSSRVEDGDTDAISPCTI